LGALPGLFCFQAPTCAQPLAKLGGKRRVSCRRAVSLDHLVGAQENGGWNFQTDGSRRLEIDDQVELRRLLHRKISRLGAFENSIHILGRAAKLTIPVDAVGYQAAGCYGLGNRMDVGHAISLMH